MGRGTSRNWEMPTRRITILCSLPKLFMFPDMYYRRCKARYVGKPLVIPRVKDVIPSVRDHNPTVRYFSQNIATYCGFWKVTSSPRELISTSIGLKIIRAQTEKIILAQKGAKIVMTMRAGQASVPRVKSPASVASTWMVSSLELGRLKRLSCQIFFDSFEK